MGPCNKPWRRNLPREQSPANDTQQQQSFRGLGIPTNTGPLDSSDWLFVIGPLNILVASSERENRSIKIYLSNYSNEHESHVCGA